MTIVGIAILGAVGTLLRYLMSSLIFVGAEFPVATLLINATGSFAMGLLHGVAKPGTFVVLAIGVGALGGFTTFSAYALEASRLLLAGRVGVGLTYAVVTPILCILAATFGLWIAQGRL